MIYLRDRGTGNKIPAVGVDSGGTTTRGWNLCYVPSLSCGNGWRAETDRSTDGCYFAGFEPEHQELLEESTYS